MRGATASVHSADRELAESLALLHSEQGRRFAAPLAGWLFPCQPPVGLSIHWWGEHLLQPLSPACVQLLYLLRRDVRLCRLLDELRAGWRQDSFIHGDMKWENIVVSADRDGESRISLVDWEFADLGDAAWDVAGVLQSDLAYQILSVAGRTAVLDMIETAPARDPASPCPRRLWTAYVARAGADAAFRRRCTRYAGARLIQTAFEYLLHEIWVSDAALAMLRVGSYLIGDPEVAGSRLLGIEPP